MPDGIQILGVYTHVTDCRGKEVERMGILRAAIQISYATAYRACYVLLR